MLNRLEVLEIQEIFCGALHKECVDESHENVSSFMNPKIKFVYIAPQVTQH